MTRAEALAEARRRYGARAYLLVHYYSNQHPPDEHEVGYTADGDRGDRFATGFGSSWEAAFADADRREKESAGS